MALRIPAGYCQASVLFSGAGTVNPAATTIGLYNPTDLSLEDVADAFTNSWVAAGMRGFYTTAVNYQALRIKAGPNDVGPFIEVTVGTAGILTGETMPANVASLVRKNTALGGRMNRGRMYIPGLSEGAVDGNSRWNATQQAARQDNLDDFLSTLIGADLQPVVFHDESHGAVAPTSITSLQLESLLATQRRRLRR